MPRATSNSSGGKAVKKTVSKKAPKKRVANKTPKKKAVTKRAPKAVKKKPAAKKVAMKKASSKTTKKSSKKELAKKVRINRKTTSNKKKTNDKASTATKNVAIEQLFRKQEAESTPDTSTRLAIRLPTHISVRALEKSKVIRSLVSDSSVRYGKISAFVIAATFIVFGSSYSALELMPDSIVGNQASVTAASNSLTGVTQDITEGVLASPKFSVQSSLPAVLSGTHRTSFTAQNVQILEVVVEEIRTGREVVIAYDELNTDQYAFSVNSEDYVPGQYRITVRTEARNLQRNDDFELAQFEVEAPTVVASTSSSTEEVEETINDPVTVAAPEQPEASTFSFALSTTTLDQSTVVLTTVPKDVESLEIYITPLNSPTKRFLTSGEFAFNSWRFYLDVEDIPNGRYALSAVGTRGDVVLEGQPVSIAIDKPTTPSQTGRNESQLEDVSIPEEVEVNEQATSTEIEAPRREFSELSLTPSDAATEGETGQIVTELMRERKATLEVLLRNYSAAVQGNDPIARRLALDALNEEQAEILAKTGATSGVERELQSRFTTLQNKIETFETLRRGTEDDELIVDTDQDGISDLDERVLFRTNPNEADTDDDGVTDAVEIMRGFNPNNAAQETVVVYESPRDTVGLVQADTLQIEAVTPLIVTGLDQEAEQVHAMIRGRGLPNSYATLYVYSTPTIVTVKTDETGFFEYTFKKELTDGEHEVYVAITDNSGSIVAQSEPFRFVKEAQAFTIGRPVTIAEPPVLSDATHYNVIAGMGVLALGIVLLMVGIGLRTEEVVAVEQAT